MLLQLVAGANGAIPASEIELRPCAKQKSAHHRRGVTCCAVGTVEEQPRCAVLRPRVLNLPTFDQGLRTQREGWVRDELIEEFYCFEGVATTFDGNRTEEQCLRSLEREHIGDRIKDGAVGDDRIGVAPTIEFCPANAEIRLPP
ncbi:hypothetical protein HRbin20_00892 [bacterium HR20]|nr:hypothetical protein HRbin20_00892 [bacterium HR20]